MGQLTQTFSEIQEQMDGVYAAIYTHENVTTQSIPTGAGYELVTNYTANGDENNCTADYANDKITITKDGEYSVDFSCSFTEAGLNNNWFFSVFVDGVERDDIHFERKIGTGGDYGSAGSSGIFSVTGSPVDVDIRCRHDDAGSLTLTVKYSNLRAIRVGV